LRKEQIIKASSAYWRGKKERESLQRVYGISYPNSKSLKVASLYCPSQTY
ncbi:hypothetical protein FRX31_018757, partial [Thalictrum thalictroides]